MATDQNFTAPHLAPDILARQLKLQQQQEYAQRMAEEGAQTLQGQMVGNHFVAPSWTQYLAKGLKSYMGGRAANEARKEKIGIQQDIQGRTQEMFGLGGQQPSAATGQGQPSPQALAAGLGGASVMPSIPGMSREQQFMLASTVGLPEYLKIAANKGGPINVAPGGSLYNPQTGAVDYTAPKDGIAIQNGQAVPVPGYSEIQAQNAGAVTGAQESAKAQYDMIEMPDGKGGTYMVPRLQAVNNASQGQQASPGQGMTGHTPSPVSQAAATKLNDDWVSGSYRPTLDAAGSASSLKNTITAMRQIPLETGFGTEFSGAAANLLTSLGVQNADKLATDVQKFQSLAMDRLQTELMKQKGPQTEGDAKRAGLTFAKLGNTPEANKFIFDFAEAKANMDMRKAAFYEAALPLAQKAGDLTEIDRRWRKLQGSVWDDPLLAPYKDLK